MHLEQKIGEYATGHLVHSRGGQPIDGFPELQNLLSTFRDVAK